MRVELLLPPWQVIVWKKDVVDVNQYSRLKPGKDLEEENGYVGIHEGAVRPIEEEEITGVERIENLEIAVFESLSHDGVTQLINFGSGLRIDRSDFRLQLVSFDGSTRDLR